MRKLVPFFFPSPKALSLIAIAALLLTGCSLYRNQDREDFDQQASIQANATNFWLCTSGTAKFCWDPEKGAWTLVRIEASSQANPATMP
jgi:hypothetical protein